LFFAWAFEAKVSRMMKSKTPEIVANCVQNYCHGVANKKFYVELNAK
jgi:hypothetical protein